jgi:hypothetical protein
LRPDVSADLDVTGCDIPLVPTAAGTV